MSQKNKKQFGVWMDNHQATIVGQLNEASAFSVLGHAKMPGLKATRMKKLPKMMQKRYRQSFLKK